jgi:LysM repeat protein
MKRACRLILSLALLALAWSMGGCMRDDQQPMASELDEPYYKQAQQLAKQGRPKEALSSYLKVIAKRNQDAPESFLEAGLINSETIKDPVTAIYFFRRYLELQPNSPQAERVRQRIVASSRDLVRSILGQTPNNTAERQEMQDQLGRLQQENDQLKSQLSALHSNPAANSPLKVVTEVETPSISVLSQRPSTSGAATLDGSPISLAPVPSTVVIPAPGRAGANRAPVATAKPTPTPAASGRKHTVQAGDSLYSIAVHYYGSAGASAHVQAIYEANHSLMKNVKDLRPGMELRIP